MDAMNHDQLIGLALSLADRWPMLNVLPEADRARVRESMRRLRLLELAPRVSPGAKPIPPREERTTIPGIPTESAGVLYRGQYRGVRGMATPKHKECPWQASLWPLTPAGDVIPCTCGVVESLSGPIAGRVDGRLWAAWTRIRRELAVAEARRERAAWWGLPSRARKDRIKAMRHQGTEIPAWMLAQKDRLKADPPMVEAWEVIRDRLWASLRR